MIHINEWLTTDEMTIVQNIYKFAHKNGITLSVGGTIALQQMEHHKDIEYRCGAGLFYSNFLSPMRLHLNVINISNAYKSPTTIGYKSDQRVIDSGWLLLVDIGYGDWQLLPRIYQNSITLKSNDIMFSIPVYPCMNTMWLLCDDINENINEIELFSHINEINNICEELDIDFDEFTTSFNANMKRKYVN